MGLSSRRLGEKIGLTAEQTNVLLKESGYLDGTAGDYVITDKGKDFLTEVKSWDNGYGGYARRGYEYNEWDENIIKSLDTSSENLERIRNLTTQRRRELKIEKERTYRQYEKERLYNQAMELKKESNTNGKGIIILVAAGIAIAGGIIFAIYLKKKKNKAHTL